MLRDSVSFSPPKGVYNHRLFCAFSLIFTPAKISVGPDLRSWIRELRICNPRGCSSRALRTRIADPKLFGPGFINPDQRVNIVKCISFHFKVNTFKSISAQVPTLKLLVIRRNNGLRAEHQRGRKTLPRTRSASPTGFTTFTLNGVFKSQAKLIYGFSFPFINCVYAIIVKILEKAL